MGKNSGQKGGGGKKTFKQKLADRALKKAKNTKYGKRIDLSWWEVEDPLYEIDVETFKAKTVRIST